MDNKFLNKHIDFTYMYDEIIQTCITILTPVVTLKDGTICNKAKMYIYNIGKDFSEADKAYAVCKGIQKLKHENKHFDLWKYFNYLIEDEHGVEIENQDVQYIFFKYFDDFKYNFKDYWCIKKIVQGQELDIISLSEEDWWNYMLTNDIETLEYKWNSYSILEDRIKEEVSID